MAFFFGDGFDLYATLTDCGTYWDATFGSTASLALSASGRFAGSRGLLSPTSSITPYISKTSGINDAVHHITVAILQVPPLTGTTNGTFFTLSDGATAQCTIVFRSDGAILLQSGALGGTTLATYTGAIAAINTWYSFEIEVVINNTTGSISVRKNGNSSNDFTLGSLNTRASANNYANKIAVGSNFATSLGQTIDDFLWRSDASSVAWTGDVRCFTRMPLADQSVQFTRSGSVVPMTPYPNQSSTAVLANQGQYIPFTPIASGTLTSLTIAIAVASTANFKCSLYSSSGGLPATALGSATPISAPGVGNNTFTFSSPPSVVAGTLYFIAFNADAGSGQYVTSNTTTAYFRSSDTYASFPTSNPVVTSGASPRVFTASITPTTIANAQFVNEQQQDGTASYVSDNAVGHADLYSIGTIASTPTTIVGVTTRGYIQKSDAGNRSAAVQIKSGGTTVASSPLALAAQSFQWVSRTDLVDPNTGLAWTAAAVDAVNIGPAIVT
jgi:hypothetical protein